MDNDTTSLALILRPLDEDQNTEVSLYEPLQMLYVFLFYSSYFDFLFFVGYQLSQPYINRWIKNCSEPIEVGENNSEYVTIITPLLVS